MALAVSTPILWILAFLIRNQRGLGGEGHIPMFPPYLFLSLLEPRTMEAPGGQSKGRLVSQFPNVFSHRTYTSKSMVCVQGSVSELPTASLKHSLGTECRAS